MQSSNINLFLVLKKYPYLYLSKEGVLNGFIEVDINDLYEIEIIYKGFPNRFPIVKEIEGRIPRKADRHIYKDGECCLTTKVIEQVLLRKKRINTLSNFIDEIVVPFFQNNSYFEQNEKYIYDDYTHGIPGHFESYADILMVKDVGTVVEQLINRFNYKKFGKNEVCFCGSGKKVKDCHLFCYNDLFYIDDELIRNDLNELRRMANKE